jgi:hypothetical protein
VDVRLGRESVVLDLEVVADWVQAGKLNWFETRRVEFCVVFAGRIG